MQYMAADARRRQLVEAAGRVIRRDGLERATTRAIAEEAGASLPTLHYAYRDKTELLTAVCEQWLELAADLLRGLVPEGCSPPDAVANLMRGFFDWVAADHAVGLAQYELLIWAIRNDGEMAGRFHAAYRSTCREALGRTLPNDHRIGPALDELTATMSTALDGCLIRLLATGDGPGVRADLERFVALARTAAGWPRRHADGPAA